MLENLTREMFADCIGTRFFVHWGGETPLQVELTRLTDSSPRGSDPGAPPRYESFSLLFRGPREPVLVQKTYGLEHEKLGAFDLFLVPILPDQQGPRYEAIINRLRCQEGHHGSTIRR